MTGCIASDDDRNDDKLAMVLANANSTAPTQTWANPSSLSDNLSPDSQDASNAAIAMDDNGNAIIVWEQSDGTNKRIYKREYRNGSWSAQPNLATDAISPNGQWAFNSKIAMDNNGNVIIIWEESDGTRYQIFKSECRSGVWTHPANLSDHVSLGGKDASSPQVAMDNNGNAIITWQQWDANVPSNTQIFKSEYRSNAWTHPASFADNISPDGQLANDPQVAMDDHGNAIITWRQYDGTYERIMKSEYRSGGWSVPANMAAAISIAGYHAHYPQVAMDNHGNAIIAWQQDDSSNKRQIFKSEYRNGSWTHPSGIADNLSPDGQDAESTQVAMDDNGNAIITWQQYDGSYYRIFKSEYRNNAWTIPTGLSDSISPIGRDTYNAHVAMNNAGDAIIVWRENVSSYYQIFKSEYHNGTWTNPSGLSDNLSPDGQTTLVPQVALDNSGNAVVVWYQSDGSKNQIFKSERR